MKNKKCRRKSKPDFFNLFHKFVDRRVKEYDHNSWDYELLLYQDGSGRILYDASSISKFDSIKELISFLEMELSKGALP